MDFGLVYSGQNSIVAPQNIPLLFYPLIRYSVKTSVVNGIVVIPKNINISLFDTLTKATFKTSVANGIVVAPQNITISIFWFINQSYP